MSAPNALTFNLLGKRKRDTDMNAPFTKRSSDNEESDEKNTAKAGHILSSLDLDGTLMSVESEGCVKKLMYDKKIEAALFVLEKARMSAESEDSVKKIAAAEKSLEILIPHFSEMRKDIAARREGPIKVSYCIATLGTNKKRCDLIAKALGLKEKEYYVLAFNVNNNDFIEACLDDTYLESESKACYENGWSRHKDEVSVTHLTKELKKAGITVTQFYQMIEIWQKEEKTKSCKLGKVLHAIIRALQLNLKNPNLPVTVFNLTDDDKGNIEPFQNHLKSYIENLIDAFREQELGNQLQKLINVSTTTVLVKKEQMYVNMTDDDIPVQEPADQELPAKVTYYDPYKSRMDEHTQKALTLLTSITTENYPRLALA